MKCWFFILVAALPVIVANSPRETDDDESFLGRVLNSITTGSYEVQLDNAWGPITIREEVGIQQTQTEVPAHDTPAHERRKLQEEYMGLQVQTEQTSSTQNVLVGMDAIVSDVTSRVMIQEEQTMLMEGEEESLEISTKDLNSVMLFTADLLLILLLEVQLLHEMKYLKEADESHMSRLKALENRIAKSLQDEKFLRSKEMMYDEMQLMCCDQIMNKESKKCAPKFDSPINVSRKISDDDFDITLNLDVLFDEDT